MIPTSFAFRRRLVLVTIAGLALRLVYAVVIRRHTAVIGDAYFYDASANLVADGHGFVNPLVYYFKSASVQAADHPPLYIVYLALFSLVGLRSALSHLVASCFLGAATVPVLGLVGRRVGGPTVGIVAAVIAALYPNIWASDGMLLSETAAILMASIVLLLAYRYADAPSARRAVALGAGVALAALSRSELLLLAVLVVVPLTLSTRPHRPWRARSRDLVLAGAACVALLTPWVAYNLHRFDQPVYLSAGFEVTFTVSNCDTVYYGSLIGYWDMNCALNRAAAAGSGPTDDQSRLAAVYRHDGVEYVRSHLRHLPKVLLARWGRVSGLYRPIQQADLDVVPEGRDRVVAIAGWLAWYPLVAFAVGGVVAMRRRAVRVYPLLAPFGVVLFAVTLTFGATRYRASAEGALCVLAAVGIAAAARFVRSLIGPATRSRAG